MSKLVKGIKKVFKKVTKFVKKYWKVIVIAAAIYFTAGVALSYFGPTAGFASSLPGFGVGGTFSKAAVWMGFNGSASVASGLSMTSGVFGAGTAAAGAIVPAGTTAVEAASVLEPVTVGATKVAGGTATASEFAAMGGTQAAASAAPAAAGAATQAAAATTATDAAMKAMSTAFKLQTATTILKTAAGFFEDSPAELMEKQHNLEWGNAFGVDRSGDRTYGWASQGGSDAFKNAYLPPAANYGQPPPSNASQWAATPGQNFLPSPGGESTGDMMAQGGQEFIPAGGAA